MKALFHPDGALMQVLTAISDLFLLNMVFLLGCLPMVTIGASLTALYGVCMQGVENGKVVRRFWMVFRENFRQSTLVWLMAMGAALLLFLDFRILTLLDGSWPGIRFGLYLTGFLLAGTLCYVFPLIARFRDGTGRMLKNAFLLSVSMLPKTIVMLLCWFVPVLALIISLELFLKIILFWLLTGFAITGWVNSRILRRVFGSLPAEEAGL